MTNSLKKNNIVNQTGCKSKAYRSFIYDVS